MGSTISAAARRCLPAAAFDRMIPPMPRRLCLIVLAGIVALAGPLLADTGWPAPAVRSGATLPEARRVAAALDGGGAYLASSESAGGASTGILVGRLTWNARIIGPLGAFGQHEVSGLWWGDISMLAFGHEVGLRLVPLPFLAVEAAYLGHRAEYEWVDGDPWALGGVFDHGAELGVVGRVVLAGQIALRGRLLGRYFGEPDPKGSDDAQHYADDQWVVGFGLGAAVMPWDGHVLEVGAEVLYVNRAGRLREGVEEITWNIAVSGTWRSNLTERFGLALEVRVSTDMLAGMAPMMEIKRSVVNEPMATATAGVYFTI